MIRYNVSKQELEALIEAEKPGWLAKAAVRTAGFRRMGHYEEASPIWSEVKAVFMRIQGNGKCLYCEREMESLELGKVEQDVEHFRPKGNINAWSPSQDLTDREIAFSAPPGQKKGYYLLPYNPFNYSAACKPCNSTLKRDYFPIAGSYNLNGDDPVALENERPYLIYPIGDVDTDPEDLIDFHGTSPRPVVKRGHGRNRALVTIEFFQLDNTESRKNLYRDRSLVIIGLNALLKKTITGSQREKDNAVDVVEGFLAPKLRHLNCARSYKRVFEGKPEEAEKIYEGAIAFMASIS